MMNNTPLKIITGTTLVHPSGHQSEGALLIEGNRIRSVSVDAPGALLLNQENVEVISGAGCNLTPGLIELHFNGALGCNLNQTSIGAVQNLLRQLPAFGITSVLFTVITGPITDTLQAIHTLEECIHHKMPYQCRPLGLHLEGPYISAKYRGTHPASEVRAINLEELKLLLSPMTKMITMAPELEQITEAMKLLKERDVRISIGHSNATYHQAIQAIQQGATSITHIYNAMRPFNHREPGLSGAALTKDEMYVQFIGDGIHVHPEAIRIILQCKKPGHILLTSDASPLAGLAEGSRGNFSSQDVQVSNGKVINQEGGLAGSSKLVTDCLRNLVQWRLASFAQAVQYATANPADFLGETALGRLEPGGMADLVLWNKETLEVEATFINGQMVYQKSAKGQTQATPA
jgi:N-acetylglucosamine-6-phosphate deacetylase